jgi:hypothetical protein
MAMSWKSLFMKALRFGTRRRHARAFAADAIRARRWTSWKPSIENLEAREVPATIAAWSFENNTIAVNNSPAPSTGSGTATPLGMTNTYNGTTSSPNADILLGVTGDTGSNGLADTTQTWRIRGTPGNGWSSQAPIGTQGAMFAANTTGFSTPLNISFDWYATTQGEGKLELAYTTNGGATWTNLPVTVPVADGSVAALTNGSSPNTVTGSFVQISGGQQWAPNLTATISDPAAANNPNFAIELVNASTGADCVSANGGALNNSSGNWRFDNISISAGAAAANSVISAAPVSPQLPGTSITLTDTITSGGGVPAGTVQFFDNGTPIGTTQNAGGSGNSATASVTVNTGGSPMTLGAHTFTAQFSVGGVLNSTSQNLAYSIGDPTTTAVAANPASPQSVGTNVTFTATITPANIGGTSSPIGNPTGTIQFFDGANPIGSAVTVTNGANNTGLAQFSTTALTLGTHNISAVYTPTGSFLASTSPVQGYTLTTPAVPFTPGNIVVLRMGDGTSTPFAYANNSPLSLDEFTTTAAPAGTYGTPVQSVSLPTSASGNNQPVTIDSTAAAGNGQLSRSQDGSELVLGGLAAGVNGGGTATQAGNRVIAQVSYQGAVDSHIFGQFNIGDDNRGAVATSLNQNIYNVGHNPSGGTRYFPNASSPSDNESGTQVSTFSNTRGLTIGFDGRLYWNTAGSSSSFSGIYTSAGGALPQSPAADNLVVAFPGPQLGKLGGIFLADVNADGLLDSGDRLYFVDDGTVAPFGFGGVYRSIYNGTSWGPAVNIGDGLNPATGAPSTPYGTAGAGTSSNLRGITGSVDSSTPGLVHLYVTEFDNVAGNNSYLLQFDDNTATAGALPVQITSASESGTTVTFTTAANDVFNNLDKVYITGYGLNGVTNGGNDSKYDGVYTILHTPGTNVYTYTNSQSGINPATSTGFVYLYNTAPPIVLQTLAEGTGVSGHAATGIRGVALAPTAATTLALTVNGGTSNVTVAAGSTVTFSATVSSASGTPTGTVVFRDLLTNTVLGTGTISGGVATFSTNTLAGTFSVSAFYAGGTAGFAPATSATITLTEVGATSSTTLAATNLATAAIGKSVTFTATVTDTATTNPITAGSVVFRTGSATGPVIGVVPLNGSGQAQLTTSFSTAGTVQVFAVYGGNATYNTSNNSVSEVVIPNAAVAVASSANNVTPGSTPTYTATVTGTSGSSVDGTVEFFFDGSASPFATVSLSGGGSTQTTSAVTSPVVTAGSHFVRVRYTPTAASTPYLQVVTTNATAFIETAKQAFAPGDLVVVRRGQPTGTTATYSSQYIDPSAPQLGNSSALTFLDEFTPGGLLVQSIALANTDIGTNHTLTLSGTSSNDGGLVRSPDGSYLTLGGFDAPVGVSSIGSTTSANYPRTVGRIDNAGGTPNTQTILTSTSGIVPSNPFSVVTKDGQEFWITSDIILGTGDSGVNYAPLGTGTIQNVAPVAPNLIAARYAEILGGQLYIASTSGGAGYIAKVGTGTPTTPATLTPLPGLAAAYQAAFTSPDPGAFLLFNHLNGTSVNPDTLYIADQTNGLLKFAFDGSNWVFEGQKLASAGGVTGVIGVEVNPGASGYSFQLYFTGNNANRGENANQLFKFTDTNAFNANFVGGVPSTLTPNPFPSPTTAGFAGIAFAPGALTITTLATNHPTTTYTTSVTFTATVTSPQDTPAGFVTFYDGNTVLGTGTLNGSGVATFTTASLAVGNHTISATYTPTGNSSVVDSASTGTVAQEVDYRLTTTGPTGNTEVIVSQVGFSSNIAGVSVNGTTVTVTTTNPLPFALNATGKVVTIAGNSGANVNGTYAITLTGQNSFTYTASLGTPTAGTGGTVSVGSSVGITGTSVATSGGITTVTVTTSAGSGFSAGQLVTIAGTTGGTNINGNFVLTSASGTTLKYISSGAVAATGFTGATAASVTPLSSSATSSYLTDYSVNPTAGTAAQNTVNTVGLPTATAAVTVSGASWDINNNTITFSSATATNLQAGQLVTVTGVNPAAFNGTYIILTTPTTTSFTVGLLKNPGVYVSGGSAVVAQNAFTQGGTATTSGYLTTSADGHSIVVGGNVQVPGSSLSGAQSTVGVLAPDGTFNDATVIAPLVGSTRAVASADGSGFWVATSTGLDFVPFGGATPSAITAASWSSANGGTATITAPNNYVAGQSVIVAGIGGATGYNTTTTNGYPNTFTVLSATATQFTYALPTQPTGTPTFTGATAQLAPTLVSLAANNPANGGQTPSTVTIGADRFGAFPQLVADAGNQFQNNGEPSIDGPFTVGSGLPQTGGQAIGVYGTGTSQNFPNARDRFQNFPTSAQFAISPDGQTVFVADSRTDGLGGVLEYFQAVPNSWVLLGSVQLDNFSITGATESGNTVTITTSAPTNFFVGESVAVNGLSLPSYNGSGNIVTSVSGNTFTFTSSFSGLSPSGPATGGAFATGSDGGVRALAADFTDNGANDGQAILYVTTSGTSGNRIVEVTGGTLNGFATNLTAQPLATAAPGTAFRGVTFAPARPGTTASTTVVSSTGNVLNATVTPSGATGWVEFFQGGKYIGTALINGGTATLDVSGILPAGTYSVTATYTGNNTFAQSSGATSLTVTAVSTSTSVSFNPATASTNAAETITATVTVPAGQNPTGLVTFTNTSTSTTLGFATLNQVIQNQGGLPVITYLAILTVPAGTFTAGTANISAAYSGDAYFASSSGPGSLSVVNGTTTTVTSNLASPTATTNQSVTLTATVTSPGTGIFTGTVQFYDNTLPLGAAQNISAGGVASVTVQTSLVQSVTVVSASNATVGSTTTVTITTDAVIPAALVGKQVTVEALKNAAYNGTFTVTAVSGKTFSYVDNAAQDAPTDTTGGLAIFLNVLTPGLHSISAVYTPTGSTFGPSTGVHQQTVQGAAIAATDIFVERLGDGITSLNTQYPNPALGSIGATNYLDELNPTTNTLVQSFILPSADSQAFGVTNATWSGGVATVTTASPNDYAVGQKVTVAGITGTTGSSYNGDVTITAVSGNTFSYALATQPTGTPAFTGATATGVVHAVVGDGQQSTTGQMTLSGDGQSLFLTGYDNNPLPFGTALPVPTATGSNAVPRSIARFGFDGSITTEAFLSNAGTITTGINSTGLFNGVYSPDGNQFYVGGSNGLYYFPSFVQSATLQGSSNSNLLNTSSVNGIESFGGNLYEISGTRIAQIGTGLPTNHVQPVTAVAWASGTATLTLPSTTGYTVGSSVVVSGITGTTGTSYNGTVTLTGVTATTISYALATQPTGTPVTTGALAEVMAALTQLPGFPTSPTTEPIPISSGGTDAYFTNLNGGAVLNGVPYADTIYVGDRGSSFGLGAITKWTLTTVNVSLSVSGTTTTGTLASGTLGLAVGQPITLTLAGNTTTALNGTFSITPTSATTFTFTTPSGVGNGTTTGTASAYVEATGGILYSQTAAQLGFYWLAGKTSGGQVTLYSTYGNGGNGDFGPGLTYGVLDSNGFTKSPGVPITAASWSSASGGTVTVTANNNFAAGNTVDVEGITPTGYNGLYTIVSANATSFTYALASNPGTATVTGAVATSVNTVNSVAFEGPGGGFLGSETTRGVAFAPQLTSVPTTTTLTDNGPNPSAVNQPVGFTVTVSGGTASLNGEAVSIEDASNGNAVVGTGTLTFSAGTATATITISSLSVGAHNLFAVYAGDPNNQASQSSPPVTQTVNDTLIVLSTLQTPSGVVITFNRPVDPSVLNEFAAAVNGSGASSPTGGVAVAVTNGATPVIGSLILSNNNTTAYFVKTGVGTAGMLPAGTDNVALLPYTAATGGFRSATGNIPLTGTTGFSYAVSAPTTPVVGVPDFARGPGQVDAAGFHFANGIPLTISNGSGLTTATVTITYNPADLQVSGVTTPLAGYAVSGLTINNAAGTVTFTVSGGAALGAGAATLANIQYTVPATATYAAKETLRVTATVNGSAVTGDDAVHVAAYAGDVDGSGGTGTTLSQAALSAQDASVALGNASASAGGTDNAFSRYLLVDPKILAFGDTTGAGATVSAQDASNIINAAAHSGSQTQVPFTPTGITPVAEAGNDPRLFFTTYNAIPGQVITVAINLQVTEASGLNFQSADLNFTYDPSLLTNPSNIRVGSLNSGYLISSNTATPGQIYIGVATSNNILANGTTGTIALIDFTVASGAAVGQSSPLNLVPALGGAPTQVDGNPANVNPYPTTAANDPNVDGSVTVVSPTVTLAFPATVAAASGTQITVPVNLTAVTPVNFQSVDLNVTYDPTKLTLVGSPALGTLSQGYLISSNTSTPGVIYVGEATSNNNLAAGTTGSIVLLTFNVSAGATGSTYLNVAATGGGAPTQVDGGSVTLSPAPTNATNDPGVDGVVNVVIQPNQPPYNSVPQSIPAVLFNPAAATGLTDPNSNKVTFAGATAITVSDPDAGSAVVTTTLTLTGTGSTGPVGVLTLGSTAGLQSVSGNGTATVTLSGTTANITSALNNMTYTPGRGFFGTATLAVSTNDNGNTGFGGPLVDTRSTSIPVVGLFISEVMLASSTDTLPPGSPAPAPKQYVEVFSTVPSYTIPSNVYFVGVNGNDDNALLIFAGDVNDVFKLGGFQTGANGYLALTEQGNTYTPVAGGTVPAFSGTGPGFGDGASSNYSGAPAAGVHSGTGINYGISSDIQLPSATYLLVESATAPQVGDDIDTGVQSVANVPNGIPGGPVYNGWNVLDGVAILDGTPGDFGPDTSYAPITFKATASNGTTLSGSTSIPTGTWTATYAARVAQNTGYSAADWLASQPTGSGGSFVLGPNSTRFAGQALNHVGGPNNFAPAMSVQVNDGNPQHSQVSYLVLTFNEPVTIAATDLTTVFSVKDAANNPLSLAITSNGTVSGSTLTGVTRVTITFNAGADVFAFAAPVTTSTPQAPALAAAGLSQVSTGLNDGNFFLSTDGTKISNNGVFLDFNHTGIPGAGGTQTDEFWRLFGDSRGRRAVDGLNVNDFRNANQSGTGKGQNTTSYRWYFDFNEDGNIDRSNTTDQTAFLARLNTVLSA